MTNIINPQGTGTTLEQVRTSGRRRQRRILSLCCAILAAAASSTATARQPATIAGMAPAETAGRGAKLPFVEYEAETATTDGTIIGPDRHFGTIAAEASGRRAVRLDRPGQRVEFVLDAPANALTVRYAIPDSADGRGLDTRIGIYLNGRRIATLPLTSRYAWFYGYYPFTNDPSKGGAHHFFDHARLKLNRGLPAGARIGLRREARDGVDWVAIDLADFERAPPPKTAPAGALSVLDFGADPKGVVGAEAAFRAAIARARETRRPVWVPPGQYRIDGHLFVDRVTLLGAGQWHSVLRGKGVGLYGASAPAGSQDVVIRDLAIIGEVDERKDNEQLAGIGGALSNSVIADLWLQHEKVGMWLDGPMDRLTISRLRILDQTADGVNFHRGVTRSIVEDSFIRNTGDDGLAMWSHHDLDAGNIFRRNTIISPILANGIAIYGGRDINVSDNLVADTVTEGGGLHLGSRFDATPIEGDIVFSGNMVVRGGVFDARWHTGVGAFWIYSLDHPITAARIMLRDTALIDSSYEAVQFMGKLPISGVTLDTVAIQGTGTSAFQLEAPGEAIVRNVVATGLGGGGVARAGTEFHLVDGGGNRGWATSAPLVK